MERFEKLGHSRPGVADFKALEGLLRRLFSIGQNIWFHMCYWAENDALRIGVGGCWLDGHLVESLVSPNLRY